MHQSARTDPSGGRGATHVPTGTHENADLGNSEAISTISVTVDASKLENTT